MAIQNQPVPCQKNHHQPSSHSILCHHPIHHHHLHLLSRLLRHQGKTLMTPLCFTYGCAPLQKKILLCPQELDFRNVRGIGNKLPLDPDKIRKIKEIIFRFYPSFAAQQDLLWCECHKAIDGFLRNRKVTEAQAT